MNATLKNCFLALAACAVFHLAIEGASADPLVGEIPKFVQAPMLNTPIDGNSYYGHDELSTLYNVTQPGTNVISYSGTAMADDFADPFDTPVVHVRWWGSYLNDSFNPNTPIRQFLIAFESDVPADPTTGNFSRPGDVLNSQIIDRGLLSPGSGTFTERLVQIVPNGEHIYEYNAELHLGQEFMQDPETVYWIKIAALVDGPAADGSLVEWGWHNRDYTAINPHAAAVTPPVAPGERDEVAELGAVYPTPVWHFQDDAVSARTRLFLDPLQTDSLTVEQTNYRPHRYLADLDGPGVFDDGMGISHEGIGRYSLDLAFELYTRPIPEPTSLILAGSAALALVVVRRSQLRRTRV